MLRHVSPAPRLLLGPTLSAAQTWDSVPERRAPPPGLGRDPARPDRGSRAGAGGAGGGDGPASASRQPGGGGARRAHGAQHGARSTEQPRPRLLELRCCGTEPGACRWRGRRGRRPELESCPARAARPAAGSGGPERVSVSVTEGGGDGLCRRPLKAGPGAERPPAGTRLPRACPRPGDPPPPPGAVVGAQSCPRRRACPAGGSGIAEGTGTPGGCLVTSPDPTLQGAAPDAKAARPGPSGSPPFLPRFTPRTKG